jgi:hypothetical protein
VSIKYISIDFTTVRACFYRIAPNGERSGDFAIGGVRAIRGDLANMGDVGYSSSTPPRLRLTPLLFRTSLSSTASVSSTFSTPSRCLKLEVGGVLRGDAVSKDHNRVGFIADARTDSGGATAGAGLLGVGEKNATKFDHVELPTGVIATRAGVGGGA